VIVFGSSGSVQAASYSLSYAISSAVFALVLPLFAIAYPVVVAMSDGRKRFTWRIIKISIIISLPLSLSVIFYSDDVINLLGNQYAEASILLKLFLLAILPNSVSIMIGQLVYAYGNYKQVLYIGLASAIPTAILYLLLVPVFGALGGASGYLIGSIISFTFSTIVARRIGLEIHWKDMGLILFISFVPAIIFSSLHLHYILGIISTVLTSYVVFLKFNIINRSDVEDTLNVLPPSIAIPIKTIVHRVARLLNNKY
jgi:O-antigen/teichoic acid export membrane protein